MAVNKPYVFYKQPARISDGFLANFHLVCLYFRECQLSWIALGTYILLELLFSAFFCLAVNLHLVIYCTGRWFSWSYITP